MDLAKTAVPDDNQIDLLVVGITYDSGRRITGADIGLDGINAFGLSHPFGLIEDIFARGSEKVMPLSLDLLIPFHKARVQGHLHFPNHMQEM
jgi:hypothetical protein